MEKEDEGMEQRLVDGTRAVAILEDELCLERLKYLNKFYTCLIQREEGFMQLSQTAYRRFHNPDDYIATTQSKIKIKEFYVHWLKELLSMSVSRDFRVLSMHQMMSAHCFWFLAKVRRPSVLEHSSNYSLAVKCYEKILRLLSEDLPAENKLYTFLVRRFAELVTDFQRDLGGVVGEHESIEELSESLRLGSPSKQSRESTSEVGIRLLPASLTEDWRRSREAAVTCRRHVERLRAAVRLSRSFVPYSLRAELQTINDLVERLDTAQSPPWSRTRGPSILVSAPSSPSPLSPLSS